MKTDQEHVKELQEQGLTVIDGGQRTVKGLPSIHDVKGLRHLGFGNFENNEYTYGRADSPKGTRFYTRTPKTGRVQRAEKSWERSLGIR